MPQSSICRLCFNACEDFKSLYTGNGLQNELYKMTQDYFHPKIVDMQQATHLTDICLNCFRHIDDFHSYQTSVMVAQLNLIEYHKEVTLKTEEEEGISKEMQSPEEFLDEENVAMVEEEFLPLSESSQGFENCAPISPIMKIAFDGDKNDFIIKPELEIIDVQSHNSDGAPEKDNLFEYVAIKKETKDSHLRPALEVVNAPTTSSDLWHIPNQSEKEYTAVKGTNDKESIVVEVFSYSESDGDGFQAEDNISSDDDCDSETIKVSMNSPQETDNIVKRRTEQKSYDSESEVGDISEVDGNVSSDIHGHRNRVICILCGTSFTRISSWRRHWKKKHPDSRPSMYHPADVDEDGVSQRNQADKGLFINRIYCVLCLKSFSRITSLRRHGMKQHPGISPSMYSSVDVDNFQIDANALQHDNRLTNINCVVCGISFTRTCSLRRHWRKQHPDIGRPAFVSEDGIIIAKAGRKDHSQRIKCSLCGNTYSHKNGLRDHLRKSHPGFCPSLIDSDYDATTKSYKCKYCGTLFLRKNSLISHIRTNHKKQDASSKHDSDNTNKSFKCDLCISSYVSQRGLIKHLKREHMIKYASKTIDFDFDYDETTKHFSCKICGSSYESIVYFTRHMEKIHPEKRHIQIKGDIVSSELASTEWKFKCTICDQSYTSEKYLKMHMKWRHPEWIETSHTFEYDYDHITMTFKCILCDKTYRRKESLKQHMQGQHWESGNISQTNKYYYDHETKMFKCKICENSFKFKPTLIRHLTQQHGIAHTKKYKCQKCNKSFITKHGLTQHCVVAHSPSSVYTCDTCGKTFNKYQQLYTHRRIEHSSQFELECG